MNDLISRQAAISEIMEDINDRSLHDDPGTSEDYAEGYDEGIRNAAAIVLQMPSAEQKPLKYSGTSICCYCKTTDCVGCLYEPMAERREE